MGLSSYLSGLVMTGYSRIPQSHMVKSKHFPHHVSINDHTKLLKTSQVLERLIQDDRIKKAASPTLIHAYLHKRTIYVSLSDPTIVTGVIDWQSTSVEPTFV
jgi:hypothetical protein